MLKDNNVEKIVFVSSCCLPPVVLIYLGSVPNGVQALDFLNTLGSSGELTTR